MTDGTSHRLPNRWTCRAISTSKAGDIPRCVGSDSRCGCVVRTGSRFGGTGWVVLNKNLMSVYSKNTDVRVA